MSQDLQTIDPPRKGADSKPIIRAHSLRKVFRMGDAALTVLKNVDLSVRPGEFVAIEGRSGSGKSTLLHLLGGLDYPDAGSLHFFDRDYTRRPPADDPLPIRIVLSKWWWHAAWICALTHLALLIVAFVAPAYSPLPLRWGMLGLLIVIMMIGSIGLAIRVVRFMRDDRIAAPLRNKEFGFVFQFYHLLPELNVLENTMLAPMIEHSLLRFRANKKQLRERATEVLTELGLEQRLRHRPNQLSGGERQRVAIARALMNNPRVLFADEPTGNLDYETGRQIMSVLERLHREKGQTIVMVTHDRSIARQADRVLILKEGRLDRPGDEPAKPVVSTLDYH